MSTPNFKIDPNDRIQSDTAKKGPLGPIKRSNKDFKDFLNIKKGESDPELEGKSKETKKKGKFEDELIASNAMGSHVEHPNVSLFDLSANSGQHTETSEAEEPSIAQVGTSLEAPTEQQQPPQTGLFNLAADSANANLSNRKVPVDASGKLVEANDPRLATVKKSQNTEFVEEKTDLSAVAAARPSNLYVQEQFIPTSNIEQNKPTGPEYKTIQQIVDQIVDKIYVSKESGRSDTTIVLKNPPLFEGVKITLSSFESAKGQYNITFENLTQMAKNVLDFQSNRDALKFALDNKGIVVQMITTTTSDLSVGIASSPERNRGDQGFGQGQEQGKNQQQQDEEQT